MDIKHDFRDLSNMKSFYYQQRYNSWDSEDAMTVEHYLNDKSEKEYHQGEWTVEKVLKELHLDPLRKKQLIKLSNGESKRLRLASALLRNPVILLVDNPFTGLDVATRDHFNKLFENIASSGVAIVMVTNPNEIPDMITHVAYLNSNHELKIFEKSDFSTSQFEKKEANSLDKDLLKKLLQRTADIHAETIIKMSNIRVKYKEVILDGINWEIKKGEKWALSGPNGSGKTTLLSLINGDNPQAYANDIELFGKKRGSGESIWDIKKKIGFMSPELYQYFPTNYTCLEVVESGFYDTLGLFANSKEEYRKVSAQWLSLMELGELGERQLGELSASQQRLCLLARALVKNPLLLILDEPCQGMDQHQQSYFRHLVDAIAEVSDMSLIYVTHYQEDLPECISHHLELDA